MAEHINLEYEATRDGCSEKLIMVNISLQEYRSLLEENAAQRTLIDKMTYDIEEAEAKANEWQKKYKYWDYIAEMNGERKEEK